MDAAARALLGGEPERCRSILGPCPPHRTGTLTSVTLRVVVAEDSLLIREGISAVLALDDDLTLVAGCADYDELLAAVEEHRPDVVITDIRMPPTQTDEGIRAANVIRATHPEIGVVVLSQYVEPQYALRLFETGSGGRAYLLKERVADPGELAAAVRGGGGRLGHRPEGGGCPHRGRAQGKTVDSRPAHRTGAGSAGRDGNRANNAAIGDALFISARSVEKHINSIFTKLDLSQTEDIHRRVRAVLLYLGDRPA